MQTTFEKSKVFNTKLSFPQMLFVSAMLLAKVTLPFVYLGSSEISALRLQKPSSSS